MNQANHIQLLYSASNAVISFREMNGRDELLLKGTRTSDAVDFVNRLIVNQQHNGDAVTAEKIATADRDRILSRMYQNYFGPRIEALLHCASCSKLFDLDFSLIDLEEHLRSGIRTIRNEQGVYYVDDDCCFRLPTGEDELAVSGLSTEYAATELMKRCVLRGDELSMGDQVQETMSVVAPVLQTEMVACCPECNTEQKVQFDIQTYFLTKIIQQQPAVTREVHQLAFTYKWSHSEIVELPRHLRRRYAELIVNEVEST